MLKVQNILKSYRILLVLLVILGLSLVNMTVLKAASSSSSSASTSAVTVDDKDGPPTFVSGQFNEPGVQPSYWSTVSSGVNGEALYTGNSVNSTRHNWATWSGSGINGMLDVSVTIPSATYTSETGRAIPLTTGAKYVVTSANGTTNVIINQNANIGKTVSLGKFQFNGTGSVYLDDIVSESGKFFLSAVVFDSVTFGGNGGSTDLTPPQITHVSAIPYGGTLYISATITDPDDPVASAQVFVTGQSQPYTMQNSGSTYAVKIPYSKNSSLNYYIVATDSHGNKSIWTPGRGYITIAAFERDTGINPWAVYTAQNGSCACDPKTLSQNQIVSDPVNTQNGNMIEFNKLVSMKGRPNVDFYLTYNSLLGEETIFGQNWTHSYNYHLISLNNFLFNFTFVQYPDGRFVQFNGDSLTPPAGIYDKLTKTGNGYQLIQKDLATITFDNNGDITRWQDANNNGINFAYSTQTEFTDLSQLTSIKADSGRTISLEYDGNGLVSKITAPENEVLTFTYDGDDNLVSIVNANGGTTKFEYNNHLITKKTSPKGDVLFTNTYDSQMRVVKQVAGTSFTQNFAYSTNGNGSQTVVTDANGKQVTYIYDNNELLTGLTDENGKTLTYQYDNNKNKIAITDRDNNKTQYQYDSNGNNIVETDPLGNSITRTFNTTFNKVLTEVNKIADHTTTYTYDSKGNLLTTIDANGKTSSNTYDQYGELLTAKDFNGNTTTYIYTSQGDLQTIKDPSGNLESFTYDGLGRQTSMTNPRGVTYNYTYDKNDNLLTVSGPLSYKEQYQYDPNDHVIKLIDANGGATQFIYDASQNVTSIIDPLGFTTKYTYGLMNEKLTEVDAMGRTTQYTYDPAYNIQTVTAAVGTSNEAKTVYTYNNMRNNTSVTDGLGRLTQTQYDSLDRVVKTVENANSNPADSSNNVTTSIEYTATGKISKVTDPNGNVTIYSFDKLDRVISKTDAENQMTTYEYDNNGNVVKTTNPKGFVTTFTYDSLNRVSTITDAKNGATKFTYDQNGNIATSTDANGVVTAFTYDLLDRMTVKVTNFIQGGPVDQNSNVRTTYGYDLNGNLTAIANPRTFTTQFKYDADNRNIQIIDANNNSTFLDYDKVSNLLKVTDRNGNATNQNYDELNRVIQKINAENLTTKYSYDKVGNMVSITDPRNSTTNLTYNGVNRLIKATDPLGGIIQYSYDPVGNLLQKVDPNNHSNTYVYDKVYRQIQSTNAEGHTTKTTYDKDGNEITSTDPNGNTTNYSYDELDRLVSQKNALNGVKSFAYDALKNTLTETDENGHTTSYSYDKQYRIIQVTDAEGHTTKITYDNNGNKVALTDGNNHTTSYSYDQIDRLTSQTDAENEKTSYAYDKETNQTSQTAADGVVSAYNYDKIYRLISMVLNSKSGIGKDNQTNVTTSYGYDGDNNLITQIDANNNKSQFQYDANNRETQETDPLGNIWKYSYDAVGNKVTRVDANNHKTTYSYYPDDQLQKVNYSNNTSVSYQYDNNDNRTQMVDHLGTTSWNYDPLNRITSVKDALNRQLSYGYDAVGNRLKLTYPDSRNITYTYYKNNWLKSFTDPEEPVVAGSEQNNTSTYQRDGVGNLLQEVKPNSTTSTLSYDKVNRITSIVNLETDAGKKTNSAFNYYYNNVSEATTIVSKYDTNNGNDVLKKTITTNYTYDPLRRLTQSKDNGGTFTQYTYDAVGNRIGLTTNDDTNPNGNSPQFDKSKSDILTQNYTYNSDNEVLSIIQNIEEGSNKKSDPGKSDKLIDAINKIQNEITNNKTKDITKKAGDSLSVIITNVIADLQTKDLTADEITADVKLIRDEVTKDTNSKDINTNESTKLNGLLDNADKSNKDLKDQVTTNFTYDNNGNRVNEQTFAGKGKKIVGTNYTYDPENRLTSALDYVNHQTGQDTNKQVNHGETDLAYDGLGRRLIQSFEHKSNDGQPDTLFNIPGNSNNGKSLNSDPIDPDQKRIEFTFDNLDPVAQYTLDNKKHENLYRGDQNRIEVTDQFQGNSANDPGSDNGNSDNAHKFWFDYDALGSVVGITKQKGQADKAYQYEDYGMVENSNKKETQLQGVNAKNPYSYTGQYLDSNMGLYEFYSRAYDPQTGSWLQQDLYRGDVVDPQSLQRYNFVKNNPVNKVDSYGFITVNSEQEYLELKQYIMGNNLPQSVNIDSGVRYNQSPKKDFSFVGDQLGGNGCGIASLASTFTTPKTVEWQRLVSALANEASNYGFSKKYGIQPSGLEALAKNMFSSNIISSKSGLTPLEIYQHLLNGDNIIIDMKIWDSSNTPFYADDSAHQLSTSSHFAKVIGVDLENKTITVENSLGGEPWVLSFDQFNQATTYPEVQTRSANQPTREDVTQWGLIISHPPYVDSPLPNDVDARYLA